MIRTFLAFFALFAALFVSAPPAEAQTTSMTFKFRAFHPNIVDVKIYSDSRRVHWPAGGQVWSLKNSNVNNIKISCLTGEKVCYGAWVRGTRSMSWGVGHERALRCTGCCYTCNTNSSTPVINLNAR